MSRYDRAHFERCAHDGQIADRLLDFLDPRTIVLADKAYLVDRIRELIQDQGGRSALAECRGSRAKTSSA